MTGNGDNGTGSMALPVRDDLVADRCMGPAS